MPWVSQYLVMKRVSIEPNFHSLYSNFLDTLKNPEFVKMVLNETYRNIKVRLLKNNQFLAINGLWKLCGLSLSSQVLLTSDKAAANFSDRSLLKNLGHWLGMITLAKNKPILYTVSSFTIHHLCKMCTACVVIPALMYCAHIGPGAEISFVGSLCERPAGVTVCRPFCGQSLGIKSAECGNKEFS